MVGELPAAVRDELIARFRKIDNAGYKVTLAELTIHAALIRQGYAVEVHPLCRHTSRRPDFLVQAPEGAVAYIEVTSFGRAREDAARSNREAPIYNAINRVRLPPGWRLAYRIIAYGTTSPSLHRLCRTVEEWAVASAGGNPTTNSARVFYADDWKIKLTLFKADVAASVPSPSPVAVLAGQLLTWKSVKPSKRKPAHMGCSARRI